MKSPRFAREFRPAAGIPAVCRLRESQVALSGCRNFGKNLGTMLADGVGGQGGSYGIHGYTRQRSFSPGARDVRHHRLRPDGRRPWNGRHDGDAADRTGRRSAWSRDVHRWSVRSHEGFVGDAMRDRHVLETVLIRRFPQATRDQIAAAANAIMSLLDQWE